MSPALDLAPVLGAITLASLACAWGGVDFDQLPQPQVLACGFFVFTTQREAGKKL